MKKTLEKLSNSTIAKMVIAAIVPGGFIVWGVYELSKLKKAKDEKEYSSGSEDKTSTDG